jgi:hypothetical protein
MDEKSSYVAILASGTREQDAVVELEERVNKAIQAGYCLHSVTYFTSTSQMNVGPTHNFLAHLTRFTFYQAEGIVD